VWGTENARGERVGYDAFYAATRDFTAYSLFVNNERPKIDTKFQKMLIRELRKISPHSPMALVNEIKSQIKNAAKVKTELIADWEQRAGASATAWHQLGQFYVARREFENSYPCYERSFALSPAHTTARDWGWAYEWAKDLEQVVPTMKLYLEEEDHGLGHSNTHYEIANFYLRHDRAEEAKPHALESAQSWSGRGLLIAAKVSERLKNDEEAEEWWRALSEAYPSYSGYQWYLWRRRSGSSDDIEEARRLAQHQMGPQDLQECASEGWWPLAYYLMESDLDRALKLIRLRLQQEPGIYADSFLLAIAHDRDDEKIVEEALTRIKEWASSEEDQEQTWSKRYAKTVEKILSADTAEEIDYESIDPLIRDDAATIGWCDACYFLSKYAEVRGFTELAARYRDWAISFHDFSRISWHLAAFEAGQLKKLPDAP
jgi:tetratricopeptide (TPR) repeat protein